MEPFYLKLLAVQVYNYIERGVLSHKILLEKICIIVLNCSQPSMINIYVCLLSVEESYGTGMCFDTTWLLSYSPSILLRFKCYQFLLLSACTYITHSSPFNIVGHR